MVVSMLISFMLVAFCVTVHASGITWSLRRLSHSTAMADRGSWRQTMYLINTAGWLIVLHLVQICLWGLAFFYGGALPELSTALYFSSVTYTTVGYGDVILPADWRLIGGVEALTGILMCGWSTGYFFALFNRVLQTHSSSNSGK
jgi:Ion channel